MGNGVKRDALGRLMPGTAMVPGAGRPKGFKRFARELMSREEPGEIANWLWAVFRNESGAHTHAECLEALRIIMDRGYGKPLNTIIELDEEDHITTGTLDGITPEGLSAVQAALAKALEIK